MGEDPTYGRRRFLKDSAFSFARAAHEFVTHREAAPEPATPVRPARTDWLRPPGAVGEELFLSRCTRCNDCVEACPYDSITQNPVDGFPVIFADAQPCFLCEDFPCISACGTEALLPVAAREDVAMGRAVINQRYCTAGQGCNACVSRCPTTALEMQFEALRLAVIEDRCVGCGLCEQVCRTVNDRIAIKVTPARLLAAGID